MKKIAPGNHLTTILLAICILMAVALALESHSLISPRDGQTSGAPPAAKQSVRITYNAPPIAAFAEITERPLFTESREPPPVPVAARAVTPPLQQLRLRLEGIAMTPGASIAVVRDLADNKILRLGEGMKHKGWELISVSPDGVTFRQGEQDQEITLYVDEQASGVRR